MANSFIGQVKMFAGSVPPAGWMPCDGRELYISQHDTLFTLIGNAYGGDGMQTFALPDMRGRVAVGLGDDGEGNSYDIGTRAGIERVTLAADHIPQHTHAFNVGIPADDSKADQAVPGGNILSSLQTGAYRLYRDANPNAAMNQGVIGMSAGGSGHQNRQPYQVINYIICVDGGNFPSR